MAMESARAGDIVVVFADEIEAIWAQVTAGVPAKAKEEAAAPAQAEEVPLRKAG
jgi:hypothetical protein